MKKLILLELCVLCAICASGQETFEKYYYSAGTGRFNLNELDGEKFLVGMAWSTGTSLLDPQGNIIGTHSYKIDTMLIIQSVKKASDNEFYFVTAYYKAPCTNGPHQYPLIGMMDSLGNVATINYYPLNGGACDDIAWDMEVISEKNVITWGGDHSLYILKADSNLMHVWSRHFDQAGDFHFVKELPGGDLLAGFEMGTAGASLMRMDANGNILWCKSYFRPAGRMHDAVIESDTSFVVVGYSEFPGGKIFMMKVDGNGEVQWCRGYNSTQTWNSIAPRVRIAQTLDDNFVLLASTGSVLGSGRPWLLKTDMNGDTLWTRRYGVNGVGYDTADLLATADGGFMFDGQGYPEGTYIFKTDSLGHLPCSEAAPAPLYITELFPVDSSFTLTSVDGATTMPAFASDTIYDAITTIDGCTVTSIQNSVQRHKTRVHPNPNSGHFTVEFTDPLTVDSFYSVYDAVGKLLFQRPLAKGQESEEIDLSHFGKGTYLVRVTSRDGVCNERVVVQ